MSGALVEQRADTDGLYLRLCNDVEWSSSSDAIKTLFDDFVDLGSTIPEAKDLARDAIKADMGLTLGTENFDPDLVWFDFDTATGIPTMIICASSATGLARAIATWLDN